MKWMSILSMLLILSGWMKHSGATDCTVYLSSQPLRLNMLCPNAICQLEFLNMRGCNNGCPSCNIDDCKKVYNLCNTSSSQKLPSSGSVDNSNEQPTNCTFIQIPNADLTVTCQKREYQLTFKSTTTACNRDLGINCNPGDPAATCITMYEFCMDPQPNPCLPLSETRNTTALNQCTETNTVQSRATDSEVTATVYMSTTVQISVYPSPTTSLKSQTEEATSVISVTPLTNTSYPSPTHSPTSKSPAPTMQRISLIIAASAAGVLVVLLLAIITGWVCTFRIMKKKGRMKKYLMQASFPNRSCTNEDQNTYIETPRFHNPLFEEQQQSTSATPLSTKPKPPQRQSEEPVYAISLVTTRKNIEESKSIQNGPNHAPSGGMDTMYHIQDYLTPIKQESKNFQDRPNKALLPDGGASVGVATQFPRKQGEIEHQYNHPACEHQYDKPVIAAKPKKLQSKKGKGVDSGGKEEHTYHVLEGQVPRDDNNSKKPDKQERKEDHKYHVLEGTVSREGDTKNPDKQEGGNVYHVLEGQTPREENSNKKLHEQEGGNVYHVLERPTPRDDSNDRNPDKQESRNVYHVLEGPTPRDNNNEDKQKKENVYHVLEGPVARREPQQEP